MGKAQILAELPNLSEEDRAEVFVRLCELQDQKLFPGEAPTEYEKKVLEEASAEYEKDRDLGRPWDDVFRELPKKVVDSRR
jgi:hypothetical protein